MKKSIVFVIGCIVLSFGVSTFMACNPPEEDTYDYREYEDDGPENVYKEN